ncbi:dTDP-glucose 4,6-dehydratase [Candidatus Marinamargulisbacteria bacterium SCGC AG-410-N11]|nr:dTDP-glucose 4,6-dehydratase [Candidatus Marinamargulisbacteria bacterium SCGC AG-410-N11]
MIKNKKYIIVTGGCGFIGSNFIHLINELEPETKIINIDCLTYAGNIDNLKGINEQNHFFIKENITNTEAILNKLPVKEISAIVHFAAESHVDRSIQSSNNFIISNVVGTHSMLNLAKHLNIKKFLHISTDEVYGSLGYEGAFTEDSPIKPNSPYSASKASSDLLAYSFYKTHKLPVIITRCSNNYGKLQYPEKLIPLTILRAIENKDIPVYGKGDNIRDWIHVKDHCEAILLLLNKGKEGEVYNIGGNKEVKNIDIVKIILNKLNKPDSLIKFVQDRKGHDFRYAIDFSKIKKQLNWSPKANFEDMIDKTIKWYQQHPEWCENILNKDYQDYISKQYRSSI